jgi:two-component system response regulator YesN
MYEVLIAEDEAWVRSAIVEMVGKLGPLFNVIGEVGNGEEAWEFIRENWPAILITDIKMPRKDGLWLVEQVYEHHLPMVTIIISGYDEFQFAKQAIRFGVSEYLLKPVNKEELSNVLERSINRVDRVSDIRDTVGGIQKFIETMPDREPQQLLSQTDELVIQIVSLKTVNARVRKSLFDLLSNKLYEMIQSLDPQFNIEPPAAEDEIELRKYYRMLIEAWILLSPQFSSQNVKLAIKRVQEYIDEHFEQNISLSEAADRAHMSVSHFSALFKRSTGVTYLNYVNNKRIEKAKEYLLVPELKIYEVADFPNHIEQRP